MVQEESRAVVRIDTSRQSAPANSAFRPHKYWWRKPQYAFDQINIRIQKWHQAASRWSTAQWLLHTLIILMPLVCGQENSLVHCVQFFSVRLIEIVYFKEKCAGLFGEFSTKKAVAWPSSTWKMCPSDLHTVKVMFSNKLLYVWSVLSSLPAYLPEFPGIYRQINSKIWKIPPRCRHYAPGPHYFNEIIRF